MEANYKRKVSEHIALLELEPNSKNLFIEGPEDANIFDLYLDSIDSYDVQIYPIDVIDFTELNEDLISNREKVLFLSKKIHEKFDDKLDFVTCIIDKDFESLKDKPDSNPYLFYTDFANLEMYLYNNTSINKILKIGLKNFPISSSQIIKILTPILVENYCLRYARESINNSYKLIQAEKIFKYSTGKIIYNSDELLNKFLNKNNCINLKTKFENEISFVKAKYKELDESRLFIHGKDFLEFFFLLIKKIKNTYSFTLKTFTRAVFLSLENEILKSNNLFLNLELKYGNVSA
ncbi:DUF4435 domain-containing protein [Polaribacter sp. AHE13PA]|jgi:hypothetical protein|uniref:DUF4435 domain-containing protein n=1 Tax=Polaribacter sp. AHE13PA TaxID=2745562 RepID=UPI001C501370|nr:DUF4435 domain-containing protein [Polaribacter sp. AHE13PA]QXP65767.1 hypothetical protein H0I28_11230 [Polaribacter sp. AHE13PA]